MGTGRPIVPENLSMSAGLQVSVGEVSRQAIAFDIAQPVTFSHFSATAFCVAMPPPLEIFSLEKSSLSKPGYSTARCRAC